MLAPERALAYVKGPSPQVVCGRAERCRPSLPDRRYLKYEAASPWGFARQRLIRATGRERRPPAGSMRIFKPCPTYANIRADAKAPRRCPRGLRVSRNKRLGRAG